MIILDKFFFSWSVLCKLFFTVWSPIASPSYLGSSRNITSAVETLEQLQTYDSDDDEFFDAQGNYWN